MDCGYYHSQKLKDCGYYHSYTDGLWVLPFVQIEGLWVLPFVKAQVAIGELRQQRPLQDFLRSLVLDEVDDDVLQAVVSLWRRVLLGQPQQTAVLHLNGLPYHTETTAPR